MKKEEKIITDDKGNIVEYNSEKIVKKSGNGAAISLPKKLLGEKVDVAFNKQKA